MYNVILGGGVLRQPTAVVGLKRGILRNNDCLNYVRHGEHKGNHSIHTNRRRVPLTPRKCHNTPISGKIDKLTRLNYHDLPLQA